MYLCIAAEKHTKTINKIYISTWNPRPLFGEGDTNDSLKGFIGTRICLWKGYLDETITWQLARSRKVTFRRGFGILMDFLFFITKFDLLWFKTEKLFGTWDSILNSCSFRWQNINHDSASSHQCSNTSHPSWFTCARNKLPGKATTPTQDPSQKQGWWQTYLLHGCLVHPGERTRCKAVPTAQLQRNRWLSRLSLNGALDDGQQVWVGARVGLLRAIKTWRSPFLRVTVSAMWACQLMTPKQCKFLKRVCSCICSGHAQHLALDRSVDVLIGISLCAVTGMWWLACTEIQGK